MQRSPKKIARGQISDWSVLCCGWVQLQGHDTYLVNTINLSVQIMFLIHDLPTWLRNKVWQKSPYWLKFLEFQLLNSQIDHKSLSSCSLFTRSKCLEYIWVISQFLLFPERYCRPEFTIWLPVSAAMPFLLFQGHHNESSMEVIQMCYLICSTSLRGLKSPDNIKAVREQAALEDSLVFPKRNTI